MRNDNRIKWSTKLFRNQHLKFLYLPSHIGVYVNAIEGENCTHSNLFYFLLEIVACVFIHRIIRRNIAHFGIDTWKKSSVSYFFIFHICLNCSRKHHFRQRNIRTLSNCVKNPISESQPTGTKRSNAHWNNRVLSRQFGDIVGFSSSNWKIMHEILLFEHFSTLVSINMFTFG